MRARLDAHARYRELLAARLDRPLTRAESRTVAGHLKTCAACQQADRDYRDQRALMRSLPMPLPPRDLWARTSTALDREMSRGTPGYTRLGRRAIVRAGRRAGAPSALATVVAALGVVTVLVALQLVPALRSLSPAQSAAPGTAVAGRPTPFAIRPAPLSIVAGDASDDLAVYETEVDLVCPQSAPDCYAEEKRLERRFSIPSDVKPENATLSAAGRVAFVGHRQDHDMVAVVLLSTDAVLGPGVSEPPTDPPTEPPTGPPNESTTPTQSATPTDTPAIEPPPTSPASPASPDPSTKPTPVPSADTTPPGQATDQPSPSGGEPTAESSPSEVVPTATPADVDTPAPTGQETAPPPVTSAPTPTAVGAEASPGMRVVSILEDVQTVGAPPAWSRDGEVLAFSAMPADGSHGPDVYVWQPGDASARLVTQDHASYFASWSGRRIVISRLADTAAPATDAVPQVVTAVIDPATLEERVAPGPELWLPAVDPQRSLAVAWQGAMMFDNYQPALREGALYLVDWAALNPFGADEGDVPADVGQEAALVPLFPDRDPAREPVADWHARWSTDGTVLGVWESEALDAVWGNLLLVARNPETGTFDLDDPLLRPHLAKRAFTLGSDSVAWIGPSQDGTKGELRIRAWNSDGIGELRIETLESLDLEVLVPAL